MLDLTKPLRTVGGDTVELVAIVNADSTEIEKLLPVDRTGRRDPGQTLLVRRQAHNQWSYQWHYDDGVFSRYGSSRYNLENAPVEVKSRRGVLVRHNGLATTTARTEGVSAVIELTTINGKLTNVEIVNNG